MEIEQLFNRQNKRIYRTALLYLKNEADAEDVVEEVILKYLKKPVSFVDEAHENAWFIVATKNYCKDRLRSFWRRNIDLGEVPEQIAEEQEEGMLHFVMNLPVKYREVLYLYYYEEYSIREMAKALNRKESTIQTQLATARAKLKKVLEKEDLGYEK